MTDALTAVGSEAMEILPFGVRANRPVDYDEWAENLRAVLRMGRALPWIIADMVIYGEDRWGERYAQAIEATGYSYQTLQNFVWVGRRIGYTERAAYPGLTFGHWSEVARLEPSLRCALLDQAVADEWSVRDLRAAVRGLEAADVIELQPVVKTDASANGASGEELYTITISLREALWIVESKGAPVGLAQRCLAIAERAHERRKEAAGQ